MGQRMLAATIYRPDYKRVKTEVGRILKRFSLDRPPVDPIDIARRMGIQVFFAEFSSDMQSVSGFYDSDDDSIVVNSEEYALRQTFTVAHELGHKILHEDWAKSSEYKVLLRDQAASSDDPREKEANAFAAHLLVPRSMLDVYWKSASVEELSVLFAVSVPVIKNRIAIEYGA